MMIKAMTNHIEALSPHLLGDHYLDMDPKEILQDFDKDMATMYECEFGPKASGDEDRVESYSTGNFWEDSNNLPGASRRRDGVVRDIRIDLTEVKIDLAGTCEEDHSFQNSLRTIASALYDSDWMNGNVGTRGGNIVGEGGHI